MPSTAIQGTTLPPSQSTSFETPLIRRKASPRLPFTIVSVTAPVIFPFSIRKLFFATPLNSPFAPGCPPENPPRISPRSTEAISSASVFSPFPTTRSNPVFFTTGRPVLLLPYRLSQWVFRTPLSISVTSSARRAPLQERIQEILHPVVEEKTEPTMGVSVPETVSAADNSIIGTPLASQQQCVRYLLRNNPSPAISVSPEELVSYYYEEGMREGIRPDVAFAQALKETGFFRYGGTVTPDQNNYCGLGTTSAYVKGAYFPSSQLGVRAHIQHLLAYASTRQPQQPVVDPRYELVRSAYGQNTLGHWEDLNGRWAVPGYSYGQSVLSMFRAILNA